MLAGVTDPIAPARSRTTWLALAVMLLAVACVYWPPAMAPGERLLGIDYSTLHVRRMGFARDALLGPAHALPAWYPRELLGTPFWSNIQNFPFLPTRLAILVAFDPAGPRAFPAAAMLSALVAALFTFALCRRLGWGAVGSAAAGWTFAASGFYASRVAAGHLPLLEAYPALPMMLWAVESLAQASGRARPVRVLVLGLATMLALLVGHPQLSIYAGLAAGAYATWRAFARGEADGPRWRRIALPFGAMALGAGCAAFALVPMAMLTAGRSTRTLALDPAGNDLALPYGRLAAWLFPGLDGYPGQLSPGRGELFGGYPSTAHFWETANYIGVLPWLAIAALWIVGRRPSWRIGDPVTFLALMGVLGILLSLPWWQQVTQVLPGTYLRSPARSVYVTELALAIVLGRAADLALRQPPVVAWRVGVAVALIAHALDVGAHVRRHLVAFLPGDPIDAARLATIAADTGDGRVAFDNELMTAANRRLDDVGFFDSVMLARSYRLVLDLGLASPGANVQEFFGSSLPPRALRALGVRRVLTTSTLADLPLHARFGPLNLYRVDDAAPRAAFFPAGRVRFMEEPAIRAALRDPVADVTTDVMLPPAARDAVPAGEASDAASRVEYARESSDRIRCVVDAGTGGVLRLIESFDPGWHATLDGAAAPIFPAQGALLAVPVPAGRHEVVFTYRTPGATAGAIVSVASLGGLIALAGLARRRRI